MDSFPIQDEDHVISPRAPGYDYIPLRVRFHGSGVELFQEGARAAVEEHVSLSPAHVEELLVLLDLWLTSVESEDDAPEHLRPSASFDVI